jgi:hypothetical protein
LYDEFFDCSDCNGYRAFYLSFYPEGKEAGREMCGMPPQQKLQRRLRRTSKLKNSPGRKRTGLFHG